MRLSYYFERSWNLLNAVFIQLTPLVDLFARCWVSYCFFISALVKINNWQSTIYLFTFEYHVPMLEPQVAAYVGTSIELMMPILIAFGLGGRLPPLILFVFNLVAALSFPFLWSAGGSEGLEDHFYWGLLLAIIVCHGYGLLSLDRLIKYVREMHP